MKQRIDTRLQVKFCKIGSRAQFHQRSTNSFYARRSNSVNTDDFTIIFMLLGPTNAKTVRRTLMK
jgi:hypothetical protein